MPALQIPPVDLLVILQILIVTAWGIALLLIDLFIPLDRKRVTGYLAIAGLVVAGLAGIPIWNTTGVTFSNMITSDWFSLALNTIFVIVGVLSIILALDYLPRHAIENGEFYVLILFATVGMMLLGQGTDLIVLFLGLELLSITLYILVGFAYPRLSSEEAAMKYLLTGAFATGFIVFGIALVFGATGTSNLFTIAEVLSRQTLLAEDRTILLVGAGMILVGFGYKISLAPFHMWTPDVYEGAPTPVTAFMSVGSKAAAFAALTRFLLTALETQREVWAPVLGGFAALTIIVGTVTALSQRNVKRLLAYSSIAQAGFILLGVLGTPETGPQSLLFYLLAYAFSNLCAFGVLIALEQRGEAAWDLADLAGLWERHRGLAIAMAIGMLSLAGVPPTAGFFAKFYVLMSAWQGGMVVPALIGVVASAVSAFFYLRVATQLFMGEPTRAVQATPDRVLHVGIGVAAVAIVLLGILPTPWLQVVQSSVLAAGR